jgi:hypothetical protein
LSITLIQDVHSNHEAQKYIAETLRRMESDATSHGAAMLVCAEAANGPFDFSTFRSFPDSGALSKIADYLLQKNYISAVSWFGLVGRGTTPIVGVDDPKAYLENVESYQKSYPTQERMRTRVAAEKEQLISRARQTLSAPERDAFLAIAKYDDGVDSLANVLKRVGALNGVHLSPTLTAYERLASIENTFNRAQLEAEKEAFLKTNGSNTNLSKFPTLSAALELTRASKTLDTRAIHHDVDAMLSGLTHPLFQRLYELNLIEKLVRFELTDEQWTSYRARRPVFDEALSEFERFYLRADERSRRMADKTLTAARQMRAQRVVLVAGGFHTGELQSLLEREAAVTVITPTVSSSALEQDSTLDGFLSHYDSLQKLFIAGRATVADASLMLGAKPMSSSPRFLPKALPVIVFLMAWFAAAGGVSAAEANAVFAASGGALSLIGSAAGQAVVHLTASGQNFLVGTALPMGAPVAHLSDVPGVGSLVVTPMSASSVLLGDINFRFMGASVLIGLVCLTIVAYVIEKTWSKPNELPREIQFQMERDNKMSVSTPFSLDRRWMARAYVFTAISLVLSPVHAFLVRVTIWWFEQVSRKRAVNSTYGFNSDEIDIYAAGAEFNIGPYKAELYRKITGGWSFWLNLDALHRTHLTEAEPYLRNVEQVRLVNHGNVVALYPMDKEGRDVSEPIIVDEFGHVKFPRQQMHPRTGYSISARGSILYGLLVLPVAIGAFLLYYENYPYVSMMLLALPMFVIGQGVMLWLLRQSMFKELVPIGPTGYRLIASFTHPYAAAWKIAWLKYKQPVLASEHAYLFDEHDPNSLYATISVSKTVWLDRLDPSLPHQKVILVNEKNANTLMQVVSLPHELFHLKFFQLTYQPKGSLAPFLNPLIFLIDEIVYFPSTLIAFTFLPIFVLYDFAYRVRSKMHHEILGPDLRRYLADYRDPDLGTKYTQAMIDYLNSDPDVVDPRSHSIVRLSKLIDGLSWRSALLVIIQALPPIHIASALPFKRFNRLTVEHASPENGDVGTLPQPESEIVPLSVATDRPIADLTKKDLKKSRRIARKAMSAGSWAIVLNVAGEGRRWVANSIRIPGFMTKAFSLSFGLNYGQGLKSALSMSLNSLSRRIPEDGVVRVGIMSQDLNHNFVQDALAWDPELEINPDRMKISVDPLRGVPSWHPEGGVKWIDPKSLQIEGSEYRLITRPPGALSSFVTLLANGRLLEWAAAGVRYVKFANGDDVGGVPDGNEMQELDESGKDVLFALVKRNVTYHLKGPWHPQDWTARIVVQGGEKIVSHVGLPEGVVVSLENGVPVLSINDQPVENTIEKTEYEKGGTPVWSNGRAAIKDDHELKHLPLDVQNDIRNSSRYYNSNQALFHLPRVLKRLGFWEGELDAAPAQALAKALAMPPDERLARVLDVMDAAGIVPAVDSGTLAEGSDVRFHNLGWKLGDVLGFLDGWFMVIDRDGEETESAYLALKTGDQPHSPTFLERVAHVARNMIGQVSEPFRLPPPHYTNVTAVKLAFIAGSLIKGRPYWAPNLWHLPQQQGEPGDRHAQFAVTIDRQKMIEHIQSEAMVAVYQKFLGPDGKLRPDQINRALNLSVILLGEEIYRRGWKIVVQDKGTAYKGIYVDANKVVFHIAPVADDHRSIETLSQEYGVQVKELPARADGVAFFFVPLADPSVYTVVLVAAAVATYFAWKYYHRRRASARSTISFHDLALVRRSNPLDVLMLKPVNASVSTILRHRVLRTSLELIFDTGHVTQESLSAVVDVVSKNNALGAPVFDLANPWEYIRYSGNVFDPQALMLANIAQESGIPSSYSFSYFRDRLQAQSTQEWNRSSSRSSDRPMGAGVYAHYNLADFKATQPRGLRQGLIDLAHSLQDVRDGRLEGIIMTVGTDTDDYLEWLTREMDRANIPGISRKELAVIIPDHETVADPIGVQLALRTQGRTVNWILARPLSVGVRMEGLWRLTQSSVLANAAEMARVIIDVIVEDGRLVRINLNEAFEAARQALEAA